MDFSNITSLGASETVGTVLQIVSIIELIALGALLFLSCWSFLEHRHDINLKEPRRRWRLGLFLACLFSFLFASVNLSSVWHEWVPGEEVACQWVFHASVLIYIIYKQWLYLFLYDRAKIVHHSLSLGRRGDKWMRLLRWQMFLTITLGIPITFYWAPFVAFTGTLDIVPNECIFLSIYPIVPIAFAITDVALAGGMSLMFLIPLLLQRKLIRGNLATFIPTTAPGRSRGAIDRMITVNAKLSFLVILSGLLSLILMALLNWLASQDPNLNYMRAWGGGGVVVDTLVSLLAYVSAALYHLYAVMKYN